MVVCNVLTPQLFWFRKVRGQFFVVFVICVLVNVGMWFERFVIIVTSLERDFLPSTWTSYTPTWIEIATLLGSFGLFFTCFLIFCRFLPVIAMAEVKAVVSAQSPAAKDEASAGTPAPAVDHARRATDKNIVATFATEHQLVEAVRAVRSRKVSIVDVFAPYAVHGLEELLGWRRSRLPADCLLGGMAGLGFAFWLQFWTTAQDWPINVGGRPWNSLPAFVPVAFECMVLLASFGLVFAWMYRCGLSPWNSARAPAPGVTDDRFALSLRPSEAPGEYDAMRQLLNECQAASLEEHKEERP